jgi:hypothetical protein
VDYSTNSAGRTLNFELADQPFGRESTYGQGGTISALECNDIGTPGFTLDSRPYFTEIDTDADGIRLTWRSVKGTKYRIEFLEGLTDPWSLLSSTVATDFRATIKDGSSIKSARRFYRVVKALP